MPQRARIPSLHRFHKTFVATINSMHLIESHSPHHISTRKPYSFSLLLLPALPPLQLSIKLSPFPHLCSFNLRPNVLFVSPFKRHISSRSLSLLPWRCNTACTLCTHRLCCGDDSTNGISVIVQNRLPWIIQQFKCRLAILKAAQRLAQRFQEDPCFITALVPPSLSLSHYRPPRLPHCSYTLSRFFTSILFSFHHLYPPIGNLSHTLSVSRGFHPPRIRRVIVAGQSRVKRRQRERGSRREGWEPKSW